MDYVTKDSGNRQEFGTGSKRDTNEGKHRFDLIWVGLLIRLAALMARGAKKYGENNWMKGQPISRYWESLLRHAYAWKNGDDPEEDHLAAIVFNVMGIMYTVAMVKAGMLPVELMKNEDGTWFDCQDTVYQDNPDVVEEKVYKLEPTLLKQAFKYLLENGFTVTVHKEYQSLLNKHPEFFQEYGWGLGITVVKTNEQHERWETTKLMYHNPNISYMKLFNDSPIKSIRLFDNLLDDLYAQGLINIGGKEATIHTLLYLTID